MGDVLPTLRFTKTAVAKSFIIREYRALRERERELATFENSRIGCIVSVHEK